MPKKAYCVYLEETNHRLLKILAAEKNCSLSAILDILINKYIGEGKK